jgi:hypothetical protein
MPTSLQTRQAARAIAFALGDLKYAVVGGAACTILGSLRETEDVDFVVPQGETKTARDLLRQKPDFFDIERRTLHTTFKSTPKVEVEILTPPALFKEHYSGTTPVVMVDGVRILKPSLILNAKCGSIQGRATQEKKESDANDIIFLLGLCYTNRDYPTTAEVPNATKNFVLGFIQVYGSEAQWTDAGYDLVNLLNRPTPK